MLGDILVFIVMGLVVVWGLLNIFGYIKASVDIHHWNKLIKVLRKR